MISPFLYLSTSGVLLSNYGKIVRCRIWGLFHNLGGGFQRFPGFLWVNLLVNQMAWHGSFLTSMDHPPQRYKQHRLPFSRFRCLWGKNRHRFFQTSNMNCCSLTTFCPQALPWCLRLGDWDASDGCSATGSEDFWIGVWTGQNGLLRKRYDFWFWLIQIRKFGGKFGRLFWYKKDPNNIRFLFSTAFGWAISKGSKDRVR